MTEEIIRRLFDSRGFQSGYEKIGEIVRCRDCEFFTESDGKIGICTCFEKPNGEPMRFYKSVNGYCDNGNRREDAG